MTYITIPDEVVEKKEHPTLKKAKSDYVGNTVDSRLQNVSTISSYIQGSKWVVDYYQQILNRDDAGSSHSDKSLHVHKQYRLIRGLPLIVLSELQASQNSDGQRTFEMTGSSSVPYDVTPIEGDVIVADIGDGREMEFTVNSTERVSIYPEAYVDINYRAIRVMDAAVRESLDSRVVETLYYSVDNQRIGIKSLLTKEEAESKNDLRKLYNVLVNRYIRDFVSNDYSTLILPGQDDVTYDPYITRFFKAIVDVTQFPESRDINILNMNGDEFALDETFWDCLIDVDLTTLPIVASKVGKVSVNQYRTRPLFNSIFFSGIKKVVRVLDPGYSVNTPMQDRHNSFTISKAGTQTPDIKDLMPVNDLNDEKIWYTDVGTNLKLPFITWIVEDSYYVLSESFYENKRPSSILEKLIIDRIESGVMDYKLLAKLATYSLRFDNIERFYYTPIILALLKLSDGVL